jgi:HEAT repeat protein
VTDPTPPAPSEPELPVSPYKNLFVPLVVVPAVIVGAIILVFLFFGAITGREASLSENVDRVVHGGQAERKQAAFNMVRQIAENRQAQAEGRSTPWPVEPDFLPKLREAWSSTSSGDPYIRLVLASLLAQLGDAEGVPNLLALLETPASEDADGSIRFNALANLGALGDPRAEPAAIRILQQGDDPGLRAVAAIALQKIPGEAGATALRGALQDALLEVRANAALALAMRGDPAGASVLRELLDPALYAAEHGKDAAKFAIARRVSESRVSAIQALARLHRAEDRAEIEKVAEKDDDLLVREAGMRALASWQ